MTTTTQTLSWKKTASGHYKYGVWDVVKAGDRWWVIYRYGEEIKGVGACTLRTAKHRVELLQK